MLIAPARGVAAWLGIAMRRAGRAVRRDAVALVRFAAAWCGRPLGVALALACGIAVADRVATPMAARWGLALALAVPFALLRAQRSGAWLALATFAFGFARGATQPDHFASVDDRVVDDLVGTIGAPVTHGPRGWSATLATPAGTAWLFVPDARPLEASRDPSGTPDRVSGEADRWSGEPDAARPRIRPGMTVRVTGLVTSARGSRGVGQVDRVAALAARGASVEISAQSLEVVADRPGWLDRAWRTADAWREAGGETIEQAGGDPVGRAALRGIVLGDRADVPPALDADWRAVGIYHVLSVSGLHLAVVAGLVFAIASRLVAACSARRHPARWAGALAIVTAVAYTLITGAQLATIRALVAAILVVVAAALDRPLAMRDALGAAAIAILAWHPADLHDPSFQLSFVAALVLAVRPRADEPPAGASRVRRALRSLRRGVATSLWIGIATAPITAFHFQQIQLGGLVGNVVLTPAVELLALPLALAGIVLHLDFPIAVAANLVALVDRGADLLAHVTPVGAVAIASPLAMVVLVALALALPRKPILAGALAIAWWCARDTPPADGVRITFLDVGQGDAALVELPGGEVWLVDAGGDTAARDPAAQQATGRVVERALRAYGHDRIDLAIVSHPHPDHYLGLAALAADGVPIAELWTAREAPAPAEPSRAFAGSATTASFAAVLAQLPATRIVHPPLGRARAGAAAGVWLDVLGPVVDGREGTDPVRSVNDNSLVVALHAYGRTVLFAGDLEAEGEAALATAADVVKVAHHGSPTSSTPPFVAATHPRWAVISCGRANRFGFPSPAIVARWQAVGASVLRTDRDGAIVLAIAADGALTAE